MTTSPQHASKFGSFSTLVSISLIAIFIFAGCSPKAAPTAESSSPTPIPATATVDQPVSTPTETIFSTLTPWPTPTPIPNTWKTFSDPTIGIQFRYPSDWKAEDSSRISGPDGYIEVTTQDYPVSQFEQIDTLCVLAANFDDQNTYGPLPLVAKWQGFDPEQQIWAGNGCVVMSSPLSAYAPPKAVLYARSPSERMHGRLLVLRGETQFFPGILSTLRFLDYATPTPSTGVYNSPACQIEVDHKPFIVFSSSHLTVTEIAVADAGCNPFDSFDGFQTNLSAIETDTGQFGLTWQTGLAQQAEINNQSLEPFGYRLEKVEGTYIAYDLYKGEELLIPGLTRLGQVSVNTDGDDFIMWVQNVQDSKQPVEVRNNAIRESATVRESNTWNAGFNTAWVGNDLVAYEYTSTDTSSFGTQILVKITRNGEDAKLFSASQSEVSGDPVVNFWSEDGHWWLEMDNVVIRDGIDRSWNQIAGSSEIFNWQSLDGRPVSLFLKNGKFGINDSGADLPISYDDIIHNRLCCDPARYNIVSIPSGIRFFALKNNTWMVVYVQAK